MAEERTLGLASAQTKPVEDLSKEELQRRLEETRNAITHTVTEIKETVANQVQTVKESLDWREQVKKRPAIWSAGAMGLGFLAGYGIAAVVKRDRHSYREAIEYYGAEARSYAAEPVLGRQSRIEPEAPTVSENGYEKETDPGVFKRLANSEVYHRVRNEAGSVGEALIQELGKTAKMLVIPAVINSIRAFLGVDGTSQKQETTSDKHRSTERSGYRPVLERNQS
jgi:hypothetical protein